MVGYRLSSFLLVIYLSSARLQSVPQSPCPNVFQYELPGSEPGRWYGVVTLSTDITLHGLWLNIVLDSKADILGNWVGEVTTTDNTDFKVENTTFKILPGPAQAVRFFIQYNQLGKVPRLSAIRLNGREICNSNNPLPAADRPAYGEEVRPVDTRPTRPVDTVRPSDTRPTRPVDTVRPSDTRPARPSAEDRPVYIPTENPPLSQSNVNPYSILGGGVGIQEVGSQTDRGRPGSVTSGTQTRPSIDQSQSRPTFDQTRPSVDQSRPTFDQTRPSIDQSRPTFDQTRPSVDQSRPNFDQSRPTFDQTRPSVDQSRPSVDQSRPSNPQSRPTGTQNRPRPGQTSGETTYQDYTDDNSAPSDSDYFSGGLPTISKVPAGRPSRNSQCGKVVRNATPLIVNGRPTLEGQWPWQIALYQTQTVDSKYICGGTLVSRSHVITAAHCITRKGSSRVVNKNTLTVYLGKHNLRTSIEGVQIKFVAEITVHPAYNASSYSRDVGVLRLREPADITEYVRAACLWPEDQLELSYVIGKRGSVVGWGFDDKGLATEELTLVEMPVVEQETCIRSYSEFFARFTSEFTYCAGYRDGTSVCNGDSGGGMVFRVDDTWYLRGLVSLSVARQNEYRCDPTHYVVFTDLAKFLPWLQQIIGSDL